MARLRAQCMLLLVAACAAPRASSPPRLAGYLLGSTWESDATSLACSLQPASVDDSLYAAYRHLVHQLRWCHPADSVTLLFSRDTLVDITVKVTDTRGATWVVWRQRLTPLLVPLWGAPDRIDTGTVGRLPVRLGSTALSIDNSWFSGYWQPPSKFRGR